MAYRRNTLSVLWPLIFIAVVCGMPRWSIRLIADLRRSCTSNPGRPTAAVTMAHVPRKSVIFFPFSRVNTYLLREMKHPFDLVLEREGKHPDLLPRWQGQFRVTGMAAGDELTITYRASICDQLSDAFRCIQIAA